VDHIVDNVIFPFVGAEIGGSHVSSFTLASVLQKDFGMRVSVLCAADTLIAREAEACGFGVLHSGEPPVSRHNPLFDVTRFVPRLHALRANVGRRSVLHFNDLPAVQSWGPIAKALRRPMVYHHRSLNRMTAPKRLLTRMADHVVCISQACWDNVGFLPAERRTKLLNPFQIDAGVDRDEARRQLIADLGMPADARLVGFVGNFWRRKRPEFFLAVAKLMLGTTPDLHFVIFGRDGETTKAELQENAKAIGIADKVAFAGFRLPAERNIASVDLLLAPAIQEPFGRTLVEAAIVGTPYVATGEAGHSEIASEWGGGRTVPPDADAQAFAAIAGKVLADLDGVRLAAAARGAVARDVDPRHHSEMMIEIYCRAAARSSGASRRQAVEGRVGAKP
jgi:glycosyltransferase involved in cell wall biosynthesis